MNDFLEMVAEILETDQVDGNAVLEAFPEWDSLAILSTIASVDSKYGINLTSAEVKGARTAKDLFDLVEAKRGSGSR